MTTMEHPSTRNHRAAPADRPEPASSPPAVLTSSEAAALLGVSSPNTVKNWLQGGHFPGATKTPGGHWRFLRSDVEALKARMEWVNAKNAVGDVELPTDLEDGPEPPLL